MPVHRLLLVAHAVAVAGAAHAAGIDCRRASTRVETAICATPELGALDQRLARDYAAALATASATQALRDRQRDWLNVRDACADVACIAQAYRGRIAELHASATSDRSATARYVGEYERYSEVEPASIKVERLADGRLHVEGMAEWIGDAATGNVNTGQIEGSFALAGDTLHVSDGDGKTGCRMTIRFGSDELHVSDDNRFCDGMNVTFDGRYVKVR